QMMYILFILKKIVSRLFFPVSLVLALRLVGAFLKRGGRKILMAGILLLYLFSTDPFGYLMLRPLESRYAPVAASALHDKVGWIVVLGGGARADEALTPEDRLSGDSLKRLMEGLRLARLLPEARLVLSGGDYHGTLPVAAAMHQVALDQGFAPARIVLESASWDTWDQARNLKDRLGQDPFYLVTSASHMPRSMSMFRRAGTRPMAAPTDFRAVWTTWRLTDFIPGAGALSQTEGAFYEYLGLLWGLLRGMA
ncbi:MAG: ElyC/SanA/YdcF family protein, partial [Desulfobacterales bacterium]|nr:ElyC/SanA/YdcF family protein [Desulfobacterales bacterium]